MLVKRCQAEFSRSANTTAYSADQVVSNGSLITFTFKNADGLAPVGSGLGISGSYMIKSAKLTSNSSGTTNASFDLYLYSSGITAVTTDNFPFNQQYSTKHVRIGKTSFTLTNPSANSNSKEDVNVDLNFLFKASATTIYGILVAGAAYTPASGESFYVELELLSINE